jgi:DNA-binding NarL/FixJ family response regulator
MEKITILIVDDHTMVRESLASLLNSDPRFEVVGAVGSGEEGIEFAKQLRPHVITMDINLSGISGPDATRMIRIVSPGSKILAISMHTQPGYVKMMMASGAIGYITKNSSGDEMIRAIIETRNSRRYIGDEIKTIIAGQTMAGDNSKNGLNSISKREIDIIGLISEGYSSRETADSLNISVKTVEVHRYNIMKKLNLKNVAALVNYSNIHGLSINRS